MKLGVFSVLLQNKSLDEALAYLASLGVQMVEIGSGGYPGTAHANPDELLNNETKLDEFKATIQKHGIEISALSCHGNMVHPNKEIAKKFQLGFEKTVLLAEKLGITQINTFSGCPGDCETSKRPNWVTCAWPTDYMEILDYQWNEVLIPYWNEAVAFAKAHGVTKIALEPHPGFAVYNTHTVLKLRKAVGPEIGANLDPSHLFWQGMDPVAVIRELGKENAIFHFHAKDTKIDPYTCAVNGVLDVQTYGEAARSWDFRTVGYGHENQVWKDIISELRKIGYDYVISIEHEDGLMSTNEGLEKAIEFLKDVIIFEEQGDMFWV